MLIYKWGAAGVRLRALAAPVTIDSNSLSLPGACHLARVCLLLSRLFLTAWVGIAIFFVMVILKLRNPELFNPTALLNHPRVLFPLFYQFEFGLLGLTLVTGAIARLFGAGRRSFQVGLLLTAAALLLAMLDYQFVYRPLESMLEQPELPRDFARLHHLSRWINSAGVGLTAVAACLLLWPERPHRTVENEPAATQP